MRTRTHGYRTGAMQDAGFVLRRTPLPRTWVNRGLLGGHLALLRVASVHRSTKLLHQPQVVAVVPDLNHLALRDAKDVDPRKAHPLACRRDASPRALVCPPHHPASYHHVGFRDHVLHIQVNVGEGGAEHARDELLSLRTCRGISGAQVVTYVVLGKDVVGSVEVALVPDFLVEAADESLIGFGHGSLLPYPPLLYGSYAIVHDGTKLNLVRTSENTPSTTFVNKGEKKKRRGRGLREAPASPPPLTTCCSRLL